MSSEELNDANKIKVTIADYKTPLVVFFGPPACGKIIQKDEVAGMEVSGHRYLA